MRLARTGFISPEFFGYVGNTVAFLMAYAAYFQLLAHVAIAINRYMALAVVTSHAVGIRFVSLLASYHR